MKRVVSTNEAPEAIGPYSQAIVAGGLVFCSGQIPLNPKTKQIEGKNINEQARQALKNLDVVLKASESSLGKVVKTTVFLKDLNDFAGMNAVYAEFFKENPPARSTVQVAKLPKDALVEIEAVAVK
ncbi:RidA family protein [Candidatus Micrarchaeota archaeon]|nr:RidA family protein [Candidatus Micrarchaeota archaeon]